MLVGIWCLWVIWEMSGSAPCDFGVLPPGSHGVSSGGLWGVVGGWGLGSAGGCREAAGCRWESGWGLGSAGGWVGAQVRGRGWGAWGL